MPHITLGILGGGQLGRMSALAAARLGVRCVIFCPQGQDCPAGQVSWKAIKGQYNDEISLSEFAELCDFITYEFENIPISTVEFLSDKKPVFPDARLLEASQDRAVEKQFLNDMGVNTAPWRKVDCASDIPNSDGILKTRRLGYDGKGQASINADCDAEKAFCEIGKNPAIWEGLVDFECEISVIVARDSFGGTVAYDVCKNEHKDGILHKTTVPCGLSKEVQLNAVNIAKKVAAAVNLIGVVAVEMFVLKDGEILVNEIAPRPHNSGHFSIDACDVCQFENHIRAVTGMRVANPKRHSDAVMINLIGQDGADAAAGALESSNACVHMYGKDENLPKRKVGHITKLS